MTIRDQHSSIEKREQDMRLRRTEAALRRYREDLSREKLLQASLRDLEGEMSALRASEASGERISVPRLRHEAVSAELLDRKALLEDRLRLTRRRIAKMEAALMLLSEEQRLLLERFLINPVPYAAEGLCETLSIERASVYRRRKAALLALWDLLCGMGEEGGITA